MAPKLKKEEKILADLKRISRLDGNKVCCDCPERMPSYVNLTHNTLVCTKCSGILRELQCRIKGISMSTFTEEEVEALEKGGNAAHNAIYMELWGGDRDK